MRYIIAAATALALIAGIALGFVLRGGAFEAEAKPPPEVQPVEEQNVDANGFIAVHEQGTADVNVMSLPNQQGRLIELGTEMAPPRVDAFFPLVDVSDCEDMLVMARTLKATGILIGPRVFTSPDGVIRIAGSPSAIQDATNELVDGASTASASVVGRFSFIQVGVFNDDSAPTDITAWIWCAP